MTAPRRLIGETSLRARTHAQRMDALSERGWFEAGWWRESKAGGSRVERIDSVRMLGGCLTAASRTRIPLIRHIVKCNYRGGLSGPRIRHHDLARHTRSIVSISAFSKPRCAFSPSFLRLREQKMLAWKFRICNCILKFVSSIFSYFLFPSFIPSIHKENWISIEQRISSRR